MKHRAVGALTILFVLVATGCGGGDVKPPKDTRHVVTLWSSMAHRGPQRLQSRLVERAIRGAVYDLSERERTYRVHYVALDSSAVGGTGWDAGVAAENARRATLDPTTFAYIGEVESGGTAVALPILNQAGVLQITPSSTAEGLTVGGVGAGPGEPYQYFPTGRRTLVRLVARDGMQGALTVELAKGRRCDSLAVLNDGSIYGAGLGEIVTFEAEARGLPVTATATVQPRDDAYRAQVHSVRAACIFYAGEPGKDAVRVITDAARANPKSQILLPDALINRSISDPRWGGISNALGRRVTLVGTLGDPGLYPRAGRYLIDRLSTVGGSLVAPAVVSGYAAAELALGCLSQARLVKGLPNRSSIIACAVAHRHVSKVLGAYRVLRRGDTTVNSYGQYRISRGRIIFAKRLRAPRPTPRPAAGNQAG